MIPHKVVFLAPGSGLVKGQLVMVSIESHGLPFAGHIGGEMSIPRAYWLGLTQHEVEFGVGHLESVVVGRLENHLFSSYINRYQHDGSNDYFDVPLRQLGERKAMPAINSISVEISLFDVNTNMTVEQKEYKITFSQGNVRPSISEESF